MSETGTSHAEPVPPPAPPPAAPIKREKKNGWAWRFLGILGFLILAGGEAYLWRLHQMIPDNSGQIADLQAQIASLQQTAEKAQPAPDSVGVQADLGMKFADLAAQLNAIQSQVAADHGALTSLQANNTDLTKLSARIELLNRLESARMALDAGQPLGDIPNAPPALAKFADTAPPTEAELVLSFPQAAQAANTASVEKAAGVSYWSRVLARLENLVTISDGTHVIVGAPAAAIVEQARVRLDAGDLDGAVAILGGLSPSTQAALGDWLPRAQDLLAARGAITAMADQN